MPSDQPKPNWQVPATPYASVCLICTDTMEPHVAVCMALHKCHPSVSDMQKLPMLGSWVCPLLVHRHTLICTLSIQACMLDDA